MTQTPDLLAQVCYAINAGMLVLDNEERVIMWNRWLEQHSDLKEATIIGQSFATAFPSLIESRVHQAIQSALTQGLSSLLSQPLNRRPFPLHVATNRFDQHPMRQAISVVPLDCDQRRYCLIQFHDVTAAVDREQELQRIARKLEQQAYQDGLTGIANRRAFDRQYQMEFRRAMREEKPLAIAMVDVDYFKAYNDFYGHAAGDDCLKNIAQVLNQTLQRPADMVARYGGEEFVVLLPDTDQTGMDAFCPLLRQAVLSENMPHQTSKVAPCVSISIGAVSLYPRRDSNAEKLLELADIALYRAKQAGRNRVCFIDEAEAKKACHSTT